MLVTLTFAYPLPEDEIVLTIEKNGEVWRVNDQLIHIKGRSQFDPTEREDFESQFLQDDDPSDPEDPEQMEFRAGFQFALQGVLSEEDFDTIYDNPAHIAILEEIAMRMWRDDPRITTNPSFVIEEDRISIEDGREQALPMTGTEFGAWSVDLALNALLENN